MPDYTPQELAALVAACDNDLGDPDLWFEPDSHCGSLALCVIDSIFSTGAHYNSVVNLVRRYRQHRGDQGTPDMLDPLPCTNCQEPDSGA